MEGVSVREIMKEKYTIESVGERELEGEGDMEG